MLLGVAVMVPPIVELDCGVVVVVVPLGTLVMVGDAGAVPMPGVVAPGVVVVPGVVVIPGVVVVVPVVPMVLLFVVPVTPFCVGVVAEGAVPVEV